MDINKFLDEKKPEIEEVLEKILPRKITEEYMEWLVGSTNYKHDLVAAQLGISDPAWDFLDRGGKRWRPAMFLLMVEALGGDPQKYRDYASIVELIHNGTIMVDDVEDNAKMRRGRPPLHDIYGVDIAINTGNLFYFLPLVILRKVSDFSDEVLNKAYEAYIDEMVKLSVGQSMDIWWHKGGVIPEEIQYLQMCAFKTGTLSRFSGRLAVILCQGTEDQEQRIGKMLESVGIAFQIQDDILDLTAKDREAFGKTFGNDIKEGKRTLVMIHALNTLPKEDSKRLQKILDSHTSNKDEIQETIELVKKSDSIMYAKEFARNMARTAWEETKNIIPNGRPKEIMQAFIDYLVERDI